MTILVTGGAGFIGSVVVAELIREGFDVVVYDDLSHGHRQAVPSRAKLVVGDLADTDLLNHVFRTAAPEAVLHFAAFIEAGESMRSPERYFRNNTANTLGLLECMLRHKIQKLVFSSTAALYGNPERTPIDEDAKLSPTNAYGESKLLVEQMLSWFHRVHRLRYASLRYFNAAGATPGLGEDHPNESHLIPLILKVALGQRKQVSIYGSDYPTPDGTCVRDYVHVLDLASAHLLALQALSSHERLIYNLGSGRGFSVREVIEVARRVTGHPIPASEEGRRPGDPAILVASSSKIVSELGWSPRFPQLADIVGSAWEWMRTHPSGYGQVAKKASK